LSARATASAAAVQRTNAPPPSQPGAAPTQRARGAHVHDPAGAFAAAGGAWPRRFFAISSASDARLLAAEVLEDDVRQRLRAVARADAGLHGLREPIRERGDRADVVAAGGAEVGQRLADEREVVAQALLVALGGDLLRRLGAERLAGRAALAALLDALGVARPSPPRRGREDNARCLRRLDEDPVALL
jgi:hypothetical protein